MKHQDIWMIVDVTDDYYVGRWKCDDGLLKNCIYGAVSRDVAAEGLRNLRIKGGLRRLKFSEVMRQFPCHVALLIVYSSFQDEFASVYVINFGGDGEVANDGQNRAGKRDVTPLRKMSS